MQAIDKHTYAQIVSGSVHWVFTKTDLPEWNNEMCPAVDITTVSPQPEVGWTYDGDTFTAPPAPEPEKVMVVDMRQARRKLDLLGVYADVCAAVSGMSTAAQIDWEFAGTVMRSDPLTLEMVAMLGWDEEQTDTFFMEASIL